MGSWSRRVLGIVVDIVRKPEGQKGFSVLPRRWAVERTLAGSPLTEGSPATTNASLPILKP
jgi:hypothetical protein